MMAPLNVARKSGSFHARTTSGFDTVYSFESHLGAFSNASVRRQRLDVGPLRGERPAIREDHGAGEVRQLKGERARQSSIALNSSSRINDGLTDLLSREEGTVDGRWRVRASKRQPFEGKSELIGARGRRHAP